MLWPLRINWQRSVDVDYEYRTEVFRARSGREQRRSLRQTPRMSIEASFHVDTAFGNLMSRAASQEFLLPDFAEAASLAAPASGAAVQFVRKPWWAVAGEKMLVAGGEAAIVAVSGTTATLDRSVSAAEGALVHLLRRVRLSDSPSVSFDTGARGTARLRFDAVAGEQPFRPVELARLAHRGREVLAHRPNWQRPVDTSWTSGRTTIDFGFGRVHYFNREPFIRQTMRLAFANVEADWIDGDARDEAWGEALFRASQEVAGDPASAIYPASAASLIDFFRRQRGMAGEFFAPTWLAEMEATAGIAAGQSTLTVYGRDVAPMVSAGYRDISVFTVTKERLVRRIVAASDTTVGGRQATQITVETPWPRTAAVRSVSWCPLWRFASDTLSISWATPRVSTVSAAIESMEALDADF